MSQQNPFAKGRQFICSCGKNYLSYAALFTHIKQKHDGKAPGPIVRPRSQRKRGRPRKNPLAQNESQSESEQDQQQNGIQKCLDNSNNIQKKGQQQKTKRAAQLLVGNGGFVAFTAYKPEPIKSPSKKFSESAKKSLSKKGSFHQSIQRKASYNIGSYHQKEHLISSIGNISIQEQKSALLQYCQSLHNLNKSQLRKLFENCLDPIKEQIFSYEQYRKLKQCINTIQNTIVKSEDGQFISMVNGICQFLNEAKQILNGGQDTKIQQNMSNQLIFNVNSNTSNFNQVQLMIAFIVESIKSQQPNFPALQVKSIYQITDYMQNFIFQSLPNKIKVYSLQNYSLFKQLNPVNFMLFLGNWLVLKKFNYEQILKNKQQIANSQAEIFLKNEPEQFKIDEEQINGEQIAIGLENQQHINKN